MRDGYSTNSRITGVLPNNATIKYDGAYCINGYRWITYIANSGQRRYIATGEVDKAGNRISSFGKFQCSLIIRYIKVWQVMKCLPNLYIKRNIYLLIYVTTISMHIH